MCSKCTRCADSACASFSSRLTSFPKGWHDDTPHLSCVSPPRYLGVVNLPCMYRTLAWAKLGATSLPCYLTLPIFVSVRGPTNQRHCRPAIGTELPPLTSPLIMHSWGLSYSSLFGDRFFGISTTTLQRVDSVVCSVKPLAELLRLSSFSVASTFGFLVILCLCSKTLRKMVLSGEKLYYNGLLAGSLGFITFGWDAGVLGGILLTKEFQSAMGVSLIFERRCSAIETDDW